MLEKDEGKGRLVDLASLVDEEHRDRREELLRSESLDEADEEVDTTVTRDVRRRVGEGSQEVLKLSEETFATRSALLHRLNESRDDVVQGLVHDAKTIGVVALEDVGAHKGEDGDDVVDELVGYEGTELGEKQEGLVVGLGVDGGWKKRQSQQVRGMRCGRQRRTAHEVQHRSHPDRIRRDAALRLDVFDNPRKSAEEELTGVADVRRARATREVDECREKVEETKEETVRSLYAGKLD